MSLLIGTMSDPSQPSGRMGVILPDDFVTQSCAILARKGAGKTYTASVMVEEVITAQLPVVIIDPTGAWWGLRSSVDGEKPGLPVVIFGGRHGDLPLEPTAGKLIADVIIAHPGAYVLDLSAFESKGAELRFVADFLERLYRAKTPDTGPLLVVVDECDIFAPQNPRTAKGQGLEQNRCIGACESIVRRGRIKGLGSLMITQRSAVLNKDVLTQTEILIVMQTTGPQDRAAIDDWIKGNGTPTEREMVLSSLASLELGEAWVWSPQFLRILERVKIRARKTFDSSRTPKVGEVMIVPKAFAKVDLEKLGEQIKATAIAAKADDPATLRAMIFELKQKGEAASAAGESLGAIAALMVGGEIDRRRMQTDAVYHAVAFKLLEPREPERIEIPVPMITPEDLAAIEEWALRMGGLAGTIQETATSVQASIGDLRGDIAALHGEKVERVPLRQVRRPTHRLPVPVATGVPEALVRAAQVELLGKLPDPDPPATYSVRNGSGKFSKAERAVLTVLAQYPQGRTKVQVALITGYAHSGGGFNNALGALRSAGLIEGREPLVITAAGLDALGDDWIPMPTGRALFEYWLTQCSRSEKAILQALFDAFPDGMTKEALGAVTGYEPSGGGFNNALGHLRTLELIERGTPRLAEELRS